jgi:hypothetical protein
MLTLTLHPGMPHQILTNKNPKAASTSSRINRVSFNLELNQAYENEHIMADDVSLHYSSRDLHKFRRKRAQAVFLILQGDDSSYEQDTIHAYEACCKATVETQNVLTKGERLRLQHWLDDSDHLGMLGMETITVQSITRDRVERKKYLYDVVLGAKRDIYSDSELVRAQAQCISLSARLFARELALALAASLA